MKKAKILYLITQSEWGGAQRYVFDLAANFKDKFEVAAAFGGEGGLKNKLDEENIRNFTLKNLVREINPWRDFLAFWEIYRLIRKTKPDILHTNSSKAEILGNLVGWLCGVKVVFTAHGFVFNEELGWWKKKFYVFWEKLAGLFADKIICVSNFDQAAALAHKIAGKNKLVVIHNGIYLGDKEIPAEKASDGKIIIGTVANFYPNKGLGYLLEAAAGLNGKFKNLEFWIVGDGGERWKIEALIKKMRLENVKLWGFQKNPQDFLARMDIFVLPSLKEGLPYVILEAMAAELPVVASRVGGIPEMIEDGGNGFLTAPKDSRALAEKIGILIENPELRSAFGKAGRERVGREFLVGKMAAGTREIYIYVNNSHFTFFNFQ